jgi:hypothetical protein
MRGKARYKYSSFIPKGLSFELGYYWPSQKLFALALHAVFVAES